jgi:hypothetical protein
MRRLAFLILFYFSAAFAFGPGRKAPELSAQLSASTVNASADSSFVSEASICVELPALDQF